MSFTEILKVILFGIVEGYTEWLPISSTGHLILVENLVHLDQPEAFFNVFKVVIQLGAILAIVVLYWHKLWPFSPKKTKAQMEDTLVLWAKIVIASIPAALVGIPFDDFIDSHLSTPGVIAVTLILYGIIFIIIEKAYKGKSFDINKTSEINIRTAFLIGCFQTLSLIPGTSRSGATIVGAMLLGCSRGASAEFSFFLGIPAMAGASLIKMLKFGFDFTGEQIFIMLLGMVISFVVALYTVRYLMGYIKKHDFTIFGYYRIVLGIIVFIYFGLMV